MQAGPGYEGAAIAGFAGRTPGMAREQQSAEGSPSVDLATRPDHVLRLPGVYRPQSDTWLLAEAPAEAAVPARARVLDICTGSGALAVAAMRTGAAEVVAIDISGRAVLSARTNAMLRRLPIRVGRGDVSTALRMPAFDVVVANLLYVPCPTGTLRTAARWDAGADGRDVLNVLCGSANELLRPGGFMLIVQSEVSGEDETLQQLRAGGLKAAVVARRRIPFGPVMRRRAGYLVVCRRLDPDREDEEVLVVRADRPQRRR